MKGNTSLLTIWLLIFFVSFTYYLYDGILEKSGERIGKVTLLEGILEVRSQNFPAWQKSYKDESIFQGSSLWTGVDSWAEIRLESGQIIKLSPQTLITLSLPEEGSGPKNYLVSVLKGKIEVDQKGLKNRFFAPKLAVSKRTTSANKSVPGTENPKDELTIETTDVYTIERREDDTLRLTSPDENATISKNGESTQLIPLGKEYIIGSPVDVTVNTPLLVKPTTVTTPSIENALRDAKLIKPGRGEKFWFVQERTGDTLVFEYSTPTTGLQKSHRVSLLVFLNKGAISKFSVNSSPEPGRLDFSLPLGKIFKALEGERIKKIGGKTQVDFCLSANEAAQSAKDCHTDLETIFLSDLSQVDLKRSSVYVKFPINLKGNAGLLRESSELNNFDLALNFREYAALYKFVSKSSLPTRFSIRSRKNFGNFFFIDGEGKTLASLSQINDNLKESDLEKIAKSFSATLIYSGKESDIVAKEKIPTLVGSGSESDLFILTEKEPQRIDRRLLSLHPPALQLLIQQSPFVFRNSVPIIWRTEQ